MPVFYAALGGMSGTNPRDSDSPGGGSDGFLAGSEGRGSEVSTDSEGNGSDVSTDSEGSDSEVSAGSEDSDSDVSTGSIECVRRFFGVFLWNRLFLIVHLLPLADQLGPPRLRDLYLLAG